MDEARAGESAAASIDAHQHFWRYNAARDSWINDQMKILRRDFLPPELMHELNSNAMSGCIAVQADQSEAETCFLLDLAEQSPWIRGVVGWVDLRSANVGERIEALAMNKRLCGFRHIAQAEPDDRFLVSADFVRGVAQLAHFGFTYDILIYPRQLPAAIDLVAKLPEQKFVLDHLAKPPIRSGELGLWSAQIRQLAQGPNCYCKISGMVTEANWNGWQQQDFTPYLDVVFEAFGPHRLMFGSDWPVCLLGGTYQQVKGIVESYTQSLSKPEQAAVFGGTATEFYGLATRR